MPKTQKVTGPPDRESHDSRQARENPKVEARVILPEVAHAVASGRENH